MISWIKKIFHKCKMETIDIPHSNKKGEIWMQECGCGKKRKVTLLKVKGEYVPSVIINQIN